MKIRNGFVSNSSSSSFTCDVCGRTKSGWDMIVEDGDFFACENDHIICNEHALYPLTPTYGPDSIRNFKDEKLIEAFKSFRFKDFETHFQYFEDKINKLYHALATMSKHDAAEKIREEFIIDEYPATYCPVCMNMEIQDKDLLKYLLKKNGLKKFSIVLEIRNQFKKYKDLKDYLKK
jgi:hypothetical protein